MLKSLILEQKSLKVCILPLAVRPLVGRICCVPKYIADGLFCPFRQPLCTANRSWTAVSEILCVVGPADAPSLEKWPRLMLADWKAAFQ